MNTDTDQLSERDEIEMLLPWYVIGKLEEADRRRVEAYLARHPQMRERLELSAAEQSETAFLAAPLAEPPSAATVDLFMSEVARLKAKQQPAGAGAMSRVEALGAWIEDNLMALLLTPMQWQWGRAVAALLIFIQAIAIFALIVSRPAEDYYPAGGSQISEPGSYVLVRFADEAPMAELVQTMNALDMTIASGPKAGGLFTVRIGPKEMSEADRNRAIAALRGRTDLVTFVTASK